MVLFLTAALGSSQTGLATVGYTIKTTAGAVLAARSTAGVVELGAGVYGAPVGFPNSGQYLVIWDTGVAGPRYAFNDVDMDSSGAAADVSSLETQLAKVLQEVQGLKDKNQRRTPDDPSNPSRIDVAIKKDAASDWSALNLVEQYSVGLVTNSNDEVERYGG